MAADKVILYGFRFSSCTWRVRAALTFKGIPFEELKVDILKAQDQLTEKYRAINPAQKIPAAVIDGATIVESMAIIQYLEDTRPGPKLTPESPLEKARVREICEVIVSGIMPLQNIGLKPHFDTEDQFLKFCRHWCERGLQTLEELLKRSAGSYCVGDQLSLADLCLVPQLYNITKRFEMQIDKYTTLSKLNEKLLAEPVFKETHPNSLKK
ncbi:hypothetical protein ABMA28_012180 [Loxostege sticticalis]|uniref:maleylacetoacetate isomerase n=1 Tax=Loxostege sticticalis TaxID=481309 RepID=A0ABD0TLW8_LOXSC